MTSQPAEIVKYGFETVFEGGKSERRFHRRAQQPEVAPEAQAFFTAEDLKAASAAGFDEGVATGHEQERATINQQLAEAQAAIAHALTETARAFHDQRALALRDTAALAKAMARKIAGKLIDTMPAALIEDSLAQCLDRLHQAPAITVRVPEALAGSIDPAVKTAAAAAGYAGTVTVAGDTALTDASVRVDWADGSATRITATLWRDIDALIDRFLGDDADAIADGEEQT